MAQKSSVTYFTFKGGLNTEASPLNMPAEDASSIENIKLNQDGSIEPRSGIDFIGPKTSDGLVYETGATDYTSAFGRYVHDACGTTTYYPVDVDGIAQKYIVVHIDKKIKLFKYSADSDLQEIDQLAYELDLSAYSEKQIAYKTVFSQFKNRLYIFNPELPLSYINYSPDNDLFAHFFEDGYARNLETITPIVDVYVNNDGYNFKCIKSHDPSPATEPGVGDAWKSVWELVGPTDSNYGNWQTASVGENLVLNGALAQVYQCIVANINVVPRYNPTYWKFVRAATVTDRATIQDWIPEKYYTPDGTGDLYQSNIVPITQSTTVTDVEIDGSTATQPQESTKMGWSFGTFSGNRLWALRHEKPQTIYFSQVIRDNQNEIARFYQFADPYNKYDSEVVDTDGGTILLVGAERIKSLVEFERGMLVMATNGIWYISGADKFTATSFNIEKISSEGCASPSATLSIENGAIYFGYNDVFLIASGQNINGVPTVKPIGTKIKTLYQEIPITNKESSMAIYDNSRRKLYYFTNIATPDALSSSNIYKQACIFRDILVFDGILGAWSKYSLSTDSDGSKVHISSAVLALGGNFVDQVVVDESNVVVVDESDVTVVASDPYLDSARWNVLLLLTKVSGNNLKFAFGALETEAVEDFATSNEDSESFTSQIIFANQIWQDALHRKQTPYIMTIFDRVESGTLDGNGEDVTAGSCLMKVGWDWAITNVNPDFGTFVQAYNPNRFARSQYNGELPGQSVVTQRHKIRGRGHSMFITFKKDGNKPFKLYGWQVLVDPSGTP